MPDRSLAQYLSLIKIVRRNIPGFKIRYKDQVWHQRLLGKVLFFNPDYMSDYTSVFGRTVYYPSQEFVTSNFKRAHKVLAHEYCHLWDRKRMRVLFELLYAAPQIFALLAFFAFWSPWFLLFLLFLAPIPAYMRAVLEMRGYTVNMAVNFWRHGSIIQDTRDDIADYFMGSGYYFMFPFRGLVRKWIDESEQEIYKGDADGVLWSDRKVYRDVYESLNTEVEL